MRTILLLTISNIFMTFAWYGHLKFRSEALWKVIMVRWEIAFFEYCFQVLLPILCRATEDYSRDHHTVGFSRLFSAISRRQIQMELWRRVCFYRGGGIFYLS